MHPCGHPGVDLILAEGGVYVCPLCEAQDVHAFLRDGQEPPLGEPADWVVPAEAEHEPRHLKPVTMRLDARDIERAKVLAKERSKPYQRYLRELIGLALDAEERAMFGPRVGEPPAAAKPAKPPKRETPPGWHVH